ncbi:MAG: hypothetical protein FJZ01_08765 [Candidatus Sericytochromatia bacterium]|nr:hypothetical protein [Candidatus Tanganyikabacteria bacterium]
MARLTVPGRASRLVAAAALAAVLLALIGCSAGERLFAALGEARFGIGRAVTAGQTQVSGPAALARAGLGLLALEFRWPTGPGRDLRGYHAQVIPDTTSKIVVAVQAYGTIVATASVTRNAGETSATLNLAVPARSNYSVIAEAYVGTTGPIARATAAGVNVLRGKTTAASLLMFSLFTPAITSFDQNAGGVGDTITLSGLNLKPAHVSANPSVILEGTAGSSVSATVTAATDTAITFKVPSGSAIGRVEVVTDGVPSYSTALFWVAGTFAIDATRAPGDTNAATSRDLVFDDAVTFSATNSWALRSGKQASDYGTPPSPTWPAATDSASFSDASGPTTTLTALPVAGNVPVKATLGATASTPITAKITALGAFADTGIVMNTARRQHQIQLIGPYLYAIGGWSMKSVERAPIDPNSGDLGSFTAASVPQLNEEHFDFATVVVGNYLYAIGGDSASIGRIYKTERAAINADGTLESWQYVPANDLPVARRQPNVVRLGRYVYVIGGDPASGTPTLLRARILDAQGDLGPWEDFTASSQLQTLRAYPGVAVAGSTVYVLGGNTGSNVKSVEAARADADGNLGPFAKVGDLVGDRMRMAAAIVGDTLLIGGGQGNSGRLGTLEFGVLTGNAISAFAASTRTFTQLREYPQFAVIGKWLYAIGGLRTGTGDDSDQYGNLKTIERARIAFPTATAMLRVKIDPQPPAYLKGTIDTFAGNGQSGFSGDGGAATAAKFNGMMDVAVDGAGNVYIADQDNSRIRKVGLDGTASTFAGTGVSGESGNGGPATEAKLRPYAIAIDAAGNLYFSSFVSNTIRKIDTNGIISHVAGVTGSKGFSGDGGPAAQAKIGDVMDIAIDSAGNLYLADHGNYRIRKITMSTGIITTVAGGGGNPNDGILATDTQVAFPSGVALDSADNLYISDADTARIRKVSKATGIIGPFVGGSGAGFSGDGGPATAAKIATPWALAFDEAGNLLFSDNSNNRIRKVATDGTISTIAGNGDSNYSGDGGSALLAGQVSSAGMALTPDGALLLALGYANRVRVLH